MSTLAIPEDPFVVREGRARSLGLDFIEKWADLAECSLEGNAFLSPHFVLPALHHLPGQQGKDPVVLAVEYAGEERLLGLGVFETRRASRLLPLRHLTSWECTHSFFSGLLLDQELAFPTAVALFRWLRQQGDRWRGLAFDGRSADSELSSVLDDAAGATGIVWYEDGWWDRAAVWADRIPEEGAEKAYSRSHRRHVKDRWRRLRSLGDAVFRLDRCQDGPSDALETFLQLEAMGWKGEQGTALLSHPGHERFAREMAAGFAASGSLLFNELLIDGEAAGSVLCLRSGDTLFSFKSGFDPRFAKGSPGAMVSLTLLDGMDELGGVRLIDSCTVPGSWKESIWPWRRRLTTGVFPTTASGRAAVRTSLALKKVKRRFSGD